MIGKNTLKVYDYSSIEEYFKHIVESQINGQHRQVRELFNKLSQTQQRYFNRWVFDNNIQFNFEGVY